MTDQEYIAQAILLAKQSKEKIPVGVVIVHNNQIISKTFNSQHNDQRIASHAEMKALAVAEQTLKSKNISGCTLYTTCEPCTMCAGALFYAKVDRIVYGAKMADIDPDDKRIKVTIEELATNKSHPPIITQIMQDECLKQLYS